MSTCWTHCLLCYPLRTLHVLQYRRRDQQVCTETFDKACGPGPILSSPCTLPTLFQEFESPLLTPDAPSSSLIHFSPFDFLFPLKIPLTAGALPSPCPVASGVPKKLVIFWEGFWRVRQHLWWGSQASLAGRELGYRAFPGCPSTITYSLDPATLSSLLSWFSVAWVEELSFGLWVMSGNMGAPAWSYQ